MRHSDTPTQQLRRALLSLAMLTSALGGSALIAAGRAPPRRPSTHLSSGGRRRHTTTVECRGGRSDPLDPPNGYGGRRPPPSWSDSSYSVLNASSGTNGGAGYAGGPRYDGDDAAAAYGSYGSGYGGDRASPYGGQGSAWNGRRTSSTDPPWFDDGGAAAWGADGAREMGEARTRMMLEAEAAERAAREEAKWRDAYNRRRDEKKERWNAWDAAAAAESEARDRRGYERRMARDNVVKTPEMRRERLARYRDMSRRADQEWAEDVEQRWMATRRVDATGRPKSATDSLTEWLFTPLAGATRDLSSWLEEDMTYTPGGGAWQQRQGQWPDQQPLGWGDAPTGGGYGYEGQTPGQGMPSTAPPQGQPQQQPPPWRQSEQRWPQPQLPPSPQEQEQQWSQWSQRTAAQRGQRLQGPPTGQGPWDDGDVYGSYEDYSRQQPTRSNPLNWFNSNVAGGDSGWGGGGPWGSGGRGGGIGGDQPISAEEFNRLRSTGGPDVSQYNGSLTGRRARRQGR